MIGFPNCKVNLGLFITEKRLDGYHNLETIFYPLPYYDVLEITEWVRVKGDIKLSVSGLSIPGPIHENICFKAYKLLKKDFKSIPPVKLHIHKNIPSGGGLGGGSADGAFTLKLLNEKFALGLNDEQLRQYALELGSDCPFFILNEPCLATGRGEKLSKITLDLSAFKWLIINPGIHIPTSWAFSGITPIKPHLTLPDIIQLPVANWRENLSNQFETVVFGKYPELLKIKEYLYELGAVYASLSGSGSTIYGLFDKIPVFHPPLNYTVKILQN